MSLDRSQSVVIEVFKRVWLPETPTNKLDAPGGINVQPSLKRHSHVPSRTLKIKLRSCFDKMPAAKPVTSAVLTVIAVHHTHHQGRLRQDLPGNQQRRISGRSSVSTLSRRSRKFFHRYNQDQRSLFMRSSHLVVDSAKWSTTTSDSTIDLTTATLGYCVFSYSLF